MAEYALSDLFEDVVIKLGDHRFQLRERTHSISGKLEPVEKRLVELPDDATDESAAELLIEVLDILLDPLGDDNGTRSHAKTVLSRSYKNEEIGLDKLIALSEFLKEKMDDRRPPSAAMNGG